MSELDKFFMSKEERDVRLDEIKHTPTQETKRHKPTRIKQKGEKWTRDYMKALFGIYTEKRSDAPWETPQGQVVYPKRGVDFFGSVPLSGGFSGHLEMEVKAFSGKSFSLSNIKPHQVKALDAARERDDIAILSLVQVIDGQVETMWWIPWPKGYPLEPEMELEHPEGVHTFAWFMTELRKRATGNFQAKSIREQDFDLLEEFAIRKDGRVWKSVANHWLARLTGRWDRVLPQTLL